MRAVLVAVAALVSLTACTTGTEQVATAPAEPAPAILTGQQAIEAAQGTPHVLWFWGAN